MWESYKHNSEELQDYIARKHNITTEKLLHIKTISMNNCLKALCLHTQATMVKFINRWIPTNEFLFKQWRTESPLCPRCNKHTKDTQHILTCSDLNASTQWQQIIYKWLEELEKERTSRHILSCIKRKLVEVLNIKLLNK